ncbi:hypothetical protein GW17_00032097 [Ensete ventricosum]|nr:hypothetical protein GW17_00032097 [Ensete ventricosum]RZR88919.1 hypothetical protein BHM03_00016563 [Ensete ventricosum]
MVFGDLWPAGRCRSELEAKEMEPVFLDQSLVFFANGGEAPEVASVSVIISIVVALLLLYWFLRLDCVPCSANGNPRKRVREVTSVPIASMPQQSQPVNLFSLQPLPVSAPLTPPTFVSLAELRTLPRPLVSTGLRLAFGDPNQHQSQNQSNPLLYQSTERRNPTVPPRPGIPSLPSRPPCSHSHSLVFLWLTVLGFLVGKGEQLQRTLAEKRQKHYRALLGAAEKSAARRLREKDAEVERAALRSSELEDRLARLRTESMAWQAKAMADQATAASLHAQLQHAAATAATDPAACGDPPPADDAESAYVDPGRAEPDHVCRTCRRRPASAVLLPCRHLCLCDACDGTAESCPVCRSIRTGSIHVFLS